MNDKDLKKSQETWDKIAESFDKIRQKPWKECIEFIKSLESDTILLDACCGNGRNIIDFHQKFKKIIAIDLSSNLLKIIQKKLEEKGIDNIELIHTNVGDITLEDNSVDNVIFIASLHNIKGRRNRIKSLKEIKRVLKKDGKALISVWSREQDKFRNYFKDKKIGDSEEFGDIEIYWKQHGLDVPRFYHLYSKEEFIEDLEQSGFKIIEINGTKICSKEYDDNYFAVVN
jgi:ubiquinone/menaquinone biosynthesis C-methylase UbiE